jgi:hypothetical protein
MISATLGASRKFSRLTSNDHRLMYVLLIPHADAEGRLDADPRILSGKAFTLLDFTIPQIEAGLVDMDRVDLIRLYQAEGERYLEVIGFHEHQVIRRKKDGRPMYEADSRIPPFGDSGNVGSETSAVTQRDLVGTSEGPQQDLVGTSEVTQRDLGGPSVPSAHQYNSIQSKSRALPLQGGSALTTDEMQIGAAAASGDASDTTNDETQKRESEEPQNPPRRPLPRVVTDYIERGKAQRAANPPRPYPWQQRTQQTPTPPTPPLAQPTDADADILDW